jgi:chromosomal replication initiator protein
MTCGHLKKKRLLSPGRLKVRHAGTESTEKVGFTDHNFFVYLPSMNKNDTWKLVKRKLKEIVSTDDFNFWFSKAKINSINGDHVVIEVPNKFIAMWLHENFMNKLLEAFDKSIGKISSIDFSFSSVIYQKNNTYDNNKSFCLINTFPNAYTFDSFINVKSNEFAYLSSIEITNNPGKYCNPLYLFSPFSCGKTHLLNAIGNKAISNYPSFKIGLTSGNIFSCYISTSDSEEEINKILYCYKNLDFLIFDDVDHLNAKDRSQKEFISIFDSLYQRGKQIVLAAKAPPGQVKSFHPDCRSRLEWGMLSGIEAPDVQGKMLFIQRTSIVQGIQIPEDVCFFLANNFSDFGELGLLICRLKAFQSSCNSEFDMSTIQKFIHCFSNNNNIQIESLKALISQYFNISVNELCSNKKTNPFLILGSLVCI